MKERVQSYAMGSILVALTLVGCGDGPAEASLDDASAAGDGAQPSPGGGFGGSGAGAGGFPGMGGATGGALPGGGPSSGGLAPAGGASPGTGGDMTGGVEGTYGGATSGSTSGGGAPAGGGATSSGGATTGGVAGADGGTTSGGETSGGGPSSGGSGGEAGSGGAAGGGGSSGSAPAATDPVIPAVAGDCPDLSSGSRTIFGLETDILAGAPGSVPGPLLFTWHGTGSSGYTALNFQLPSSVRDDIVAQGGVIIAPNDDGTTREGSSANGVWYETSDLEYADQIVACAVQNHNIDPRRIYVTGCSAGGLMAGAMAVKRSTYVAAAAPSSGGLTSTFGVSLQDPTRVPAVMNMHGGAGDNVIINFETTSANLAEVISPAGGFVVDCNHQSGHCGPPDALYESAWQFMLAHPFGTVPSPYAAGLPASFPAYCQIW
jgi:dienelactone hydrolase